MGAAGAVGAAFGGFDICAIEGWGGEFDAVQEHGLVDVGGAGHFVVDAGMTVSGGWDVLTEVEPYQIEWSSSNVGMIPSLRGKIRELWGK